MGLARNREIKTISVLTNSLSYILFYFSLQRNLSLLRYKNVHFWRRLTDYRARPKMKQVLGKHILNNVTDLSDQKRSIQLYIFTVIILFILKNTWGQVI